MAKNNRLPFNLIQESRKTVLAGAILFLVTAYIVGSKAIDTGSWLVYFATFLLVIGALRAIIRSINYENER